MVRSEPDVSSRPNVLAQEDGDRTDYRFPVAVASSPVLRDVAVDWDGKRVIEARDGTFPGAGRVGVWTKADSFTLFDNLTVTSLAP